MKRKPCKCGSYPKLRKRQDNIICVEYVLVCPGCGKRVYRSGLDNKTTLKEINDSWNNYEADE